MSKEELEKLLLGKCLNGFTITKVEYDPFIKEQINLITDGVKIVPPCNDRDIVIFRLRDKNTFGASWNEELVNKEHQALLDIKEYIERNKGSWEVSTFSQREDVRKIVWTNEELDILDIVNKALGDKENE